MGNLQLGRCIFVKPVNIEKWQNADNYSAEEELNSLLWFLFVLFVIYLLCLRKTANKIELIKI